MNFIKKFGTNKPYASKMAAKRIKELKEEIHFEGNLQPIQIAGHNAPKEKLISPKQIKIGYKFQDTLMIRPKTRSPVKLQMAQCPCHG